VGPVVVKLLDAGDRVVVHQRHAGFEPESLARWAELCAGGGVVLDIGAYTGIYSIAAAMLGASPIAFEPMRRHRDRLRQNAGINGVAVLVLGGAVFSGIGQEILTYKEASWFTSGASLVRSIGNAHTIVDTYPLDALYISDVAAIKIDTEGAEPAILRGARETLARWGPPMIVEVSDDYGAMKAVFDEAPGYRMVERLDRRNILMRCE